MSPTAHQSPRVHFFIRAHPCSSVDALFPSTEIGVQPLQQGGEVARRGDAVDGPVRSHDDRLVGEQETGRGTGGIRNRHNLGADALQQRKGSVIEVRLREMNQLVDALDPAPFCEKDLDRRAEDFIVESARELPRTGELSLVVFLDGPTDTADDRIVGEAIRAHFARRSNLLRRELRQLLRRGLISLGIGVAFLATFFLMAQLISRLLGESHWATLFRAGLLIVGWVAITICIFNYICNTIVITVCIACIRNTITIRIFCWRFKCITGTIITCIRNTIAIGINTVVT